MKVSYIECKEYERNDVVVFTKDTDYGMITGDIGVVMGENSYNGYLFKVHSGVKNLLGYDVEYIGRLD